MSVVVLQAWIEQGSARRAGGGGQVLCGAATGVLPPGDCVASRFISARNDPAGGTGTLVPGAAEAVVELKLNGVVIDEIRTPVTLQ